MSFPGFSLCCPENRCRGLSAIVACLGIRDGLIRPPGLNQSWGQAVTALLRIPGTHFFLDKDTLWDTLCGRTAAEWLKETHLPPVPPHKGAPTISEALCCPAFSWVLAHSLGRCKEENSKFIRS